MPLSEKLYTLRKERSLSQEELAEAMQVSRQAISKWESGISIPESEKLLIISRYFGVSVDWLLKDEVEMPELSGASGQPEKAGQTAQPAAESQVFGTPFWVGLFACIGGAVALMIVGLVSLCSPSVSEQIGASSTVMLDGNGVVCLLACLFLVIGAVLLFRGHNKKK